MKGGKDGTNLDCVIISPSSCCLESSVAMVAIVLYVSPGIHQHLDDLVISPECGSGQSGVTKPVQSINFSRVIGQQQLRSV